MQQNLDNIIELASKGKILTTEQVDKFLTMVLSSLSTQRKELNTESKQRMSEISQVMKYIESEHKNILDEWTSKLDTKSQKIISDFKSNLDEAKSTLKDVKQLLEDVQSIEVKDGKDADEEVIVEKVIDRIKIEPDVLTLSAEDIKSKLESLKGKKKLDISSVKGFDLYAKKVDLDYAVKTLQHQISFLINRNNTSTGSSTTLQTNGTPNGSQSLLNLKNGTNVTITDDGSGGVTISAATSSSGIVRSVNSISSPTTAGSAAATDYVYLVTGTTTVTLPTAVGNTNLYTVKRVGTNTVTVATTGGETIDGSATASITVQYTSYDFISDGTNWNVV